MLTSQRVVNPNSLKFHPYDDTDLVELRNQVISSSKLLVDSQLFSEEHSFDDLLEKIFKFKGSTDAQVQEKVDKLFQFSKLPFDPFVIEHEKGLFVLTNSDKGIKFKAIHSDGSVHPFGASLDRIVRENSKLSLNAHSICSPRYELHVRNSYAAHINGTFQKCSKNTEGARSLHDCEAQWSVMCLVQVMYILMLLNAKNVGTTKIKPSNKESQNVPKFLRPKFEYHILNLDRRVKELKTLMDVQNYFLHIPSDRRMHMVRGHFKCLNGNLHWWSPHLRNKTANEFLDKDYKLIV
jgi:hypothetical protein